MTKVKKKERARNAFNKNISLFRCPVCSGPMMRTDAYGLSCAAGHDFDLSRKGYVNLLTARQNSVYDQELFQARREVFEAGLFEPIVAKTQEVINELSSDPITLLDAGCGEGSFLHSLSKEMGSVSAALLGIDISREGIHLAASYNDPILWCVADLAQLPLQNASMDIILNVLSPANYREFQRVLKPTGAVIKVIPGQDYLRELRDVMKIEQGETTYSNEQVVRHLEENLEIETVYPVRYEFKVVPSLWPSLVRMTPLTWNKSIHQQWDSFHERITRITVDLEIVVGVPNH